LATAFGHPAKFRLADLSFRKCTQVVATAPLPCPITIAWAEKDTLLPVELYETAVKERLPGAVFTILPGVGHMPMLDDPKLVARTILAVTSANGQVTSGSPQPAQSIRWSVQIRIK
jgi:pimeloyl-ACP methyl ester carboxylesterase